MDELSSIALACALAWASGIRLYAVLLLVGLAGHFHWFGWQAPENLSVLSHKLVMASTAMLLALEFLADKVPGIDSAWDVIHTFIRIPAGALLAAGVIGTDDNAAWTIAAGLLGGSITAGTHFTKATARAAINTSPEPVSNLVASTSEDGLVIAGLLLAITHPALFLAGLALFVAMAIWLLPKLYRLIRGTARRMLERAAGN